MKLVIGAGELLWDLLPKGKQLGGAPGNFAYHVQQQGCRGLIVSALGQDRLGDELLATLTRKGVSTEHIARTADWPTGTVHVELKDGKPTYNIVKDVAWDHIPLTSAIREHATQAAAICFGTLAQREQASRDTIMALLKLAPPHCLRVFDVNLRQNFYDAALIESSLRLSDLFKLSDEELTEIASMLNLPSDEGDFCKAVRDRFGVQRVAVTAGGEGSRVHDADGVHAQQPVKVDAINTVGAGDSFTAGLVSGLLRGDSVEQAQAYAAKLAAFVCTQNSAMPEVPAALRAGG